MIALATIVGQTVVEVFSGAVEASEGPELTGVAGSVWHYADLLVRLSGGHVLSFGPGQCVLLPEIPPDASSCQLLDDFGETCIGKRVIDLVRVATGEPSLYLLLEGSSYLEHSYVPGGSRHFFGTLREWASEDLGEEVVSLTSGQRQTWESLMV